MPGDSPLAIMPKPAREKAVPYAPATSGRAMPNVASPTNVGLPPPIGHAQTCTASTPVPEGAPRSMAHPASWSPARGTVVALAGVSTFIRGAEKGPEGAGVAVAAVVLKLLTNCPPTALYANAVTTSHVGFFVLATRR